ncbi:TYRO protein tyrosine kinase-binding protein [Hemicordylus capensis]|uniref:TYRO protein tyrosine kinase-binding protein n=1 Tax=Hemicordylus capensis TaxID=884348 RepID=UPI0023036877|nr:TYRO protein tyrosine kinase-binding protein [Hemicordylus capensis]
MDPKVRYHCCPWGPGFHFFGKSHHLQERDFSVSNIPNLGVFAMGQRAFPVLHFLLGLAWTQMGAAQDSTGQVQKDCSQCYQLNAGTIAGVVIGDLLLTLLIALAVYYMASCIYQRQNASSGGGSSTKAELESPYQELQGARMDIYSDLKRPGLNY